MITPLDSFCCVLWISKAFGTCSPRQIRARSKPSQAHLGILANVSYSQFDPFFSYIHRGCSLISLPVARHQKRKPRAQLIDMLRPALRAQITKGWSSMGVVNGQTSSSSRRWAARAACLAASCCSHCCWASLAAAMEAACGDVCTAWG